MVYGSVFLSCFMKIEVILELFDSSMTCTVKNKISVMVKFGGKKMTSKKESVKRIGILTSGGDCPGLNATIRGFVKAAYNRMDCEFIGIKNGYKGLIDGDYIEMVEKDFWGLLHRGGTMLKSVRTPFKEMREIGEDGVDKVKAMIDNYHKLELDCLVCLGGAGTHKNANLLREEGLNVVALPKTIDNDIWGTDVTFGYQSAVDTATDILDRLHTTADSHNRIMVVEMMGNKVGWLALNAGIAGGADIILIPEIPYTDEGIIKAIQKRHDKGKDFSIVVVAEGAKSLAETKMSKKELKAYREECGQSNIAQRIGKMIEKKMGIETRVVIPGHILRGGSPTAFDRTLATGLGAYAAKLVDEEHYGFTVSVKGNDFVATPLSEVAGFRKSVEPDNTLIKTAKDIGISFAEEEQEEDENE